LKLLTETVSGISTRIPWGFVGLGIGGIKLVTPATSSSWAKTSVPEEEYTIPLGVADVKKPGEDVTVVANLIMLHHALNAAEKLEAAVLPGEADIQKAIRELVAN
jgi:hypothetical protein